MYLYNNNNTNNTTRSLGVQRKHRSTVSFLMFCISFGLSIIYASFVLISRLPTATTSHDKKIEDSPQLQLQLPAHVSHHLRGLADSIPQQHQDTNIHKSIKQTQYWNVTSWLDFHATNQPNLLTSSAEKSNYMCSTNPTSINTTISEGLGSDIVSAVSLSPPSLTKVWPMTKDYLPIYINFRAYDNITNAQDNGGDVFVLEYQSWSSIGNTTVKSAAFTNDNLDGTHSATLFLPRSMSIDHLYVTLRHYYTCHQGLKRPAELKNCGDICQLDFGPTVWPQLSDAILSEVGNNLPEEYPSKEVEVDHRCSHFDEVLFGVWKEEGIHYPIMSTKGADWYPIYCNLEKDKLPPLRGKEHKIGDSTMPYRIAEVGYPYSPHRGDKHDIAYADALWNTLRNANEYDIVVFGGGLHHLYHMNFNHQSIAKLLIKSMCQIGLVFPSDEEILLRGPNTIQQHLNNRVDQTALNARMINWELRSILIEHDYKLETLCEYIITSSDGGISISSLAHLADDKGDIMSDSDTVAQLKKKRHNFNESQYNSTQLALSKHLENLSASDRQNLYRNRTIRWIDTEMFMLPRQEEYRPNDKVHDKVEFFFHKHAQLYGHLERISNRDRLEQ